MSKFCQITGKKPMMGNKVSHANNKTKRIFNLNLSKKRFFIKKKWILLKVSSAGIKTINKFGIEKTLKKLNVKKKY